MRDTNSIPIKTCATLSNTFTIEYRITDTSLELMLIITPSMFLFGCFLTKVVTVTMCDWSNYL